MLEGGTPSTTIFSTSDVRFIDFDCAPIGKRPVSLLHQLFPNQERHAPRGLVGDAQFTFKLLGRDAAASACHQVHGVEPQVERRRRLVEDRSSGRMQVMAARGAGPRLTLLRSLVAFKDTLCVALGACGVLPIFGKLSASEPFQTGCIVRKFAHEIHERVLRLRGCGADWFVSICGCHDSFSLVGRM
jgi:hypothetical protein